MVSQLTFLAMSLPIVTVIIGHGTETSVHYVIPIKYSAQNGMENGESIQNRP